MADPRKDPKTATTHQEHLKQQRAKASQIKSNPNFATSGTEFKATKPSPAKTDDKTKKEVAYVAKSVGTNLTQRHNNAKEMLGEDAKYGNKGGIGEKKMTVNTAYNSMLPEFEVTAPSKMYKSPAKMDTVDPTTGQVLPTGMGQGPTNVGNANTAQTLQKQADAAAVKANRAGAPDRSASSISQTPMTMQGNFKNNSMAHAARMFGNVPNPVPSPSQFNSGLRKASAEGKLDNNPNFKSKVDAAPTKAIPVGAIIKGVQAVGALKSAAKAKGNPEIKGTVLPELDVEYIPATTSSGASRSTNTMTEVDSDGKPTGVTRDSTKAEKAQMIKDAQSNRGTGRINKSYTDEKGNKIPLGPSEFHVSF